MIYCTQKEWVRTDEQGKVWCQVVLTAPSAPSSLNITGEDVDGMLDTEYCSAGSVLLTPGTNYIAYEDGVFSNVEGA